MSTSNLESPDSDKTIKSRYFINEKGHRIHQDAIGHEWFMKAPTGGYDMGFENIFYNQILDKDFKDAVYQKMYATTSTKESLKYEDVWYNIFINQDNSDQTSISTKSTKKYEDITEEGEEVKDAPKSTGSNKDGQKRDRSIVDKWKYHRQPLEESEKEIPLEKYWVIEKGVPPLIIQEGSEKYILTRLNHITFNY